ncbi:hypothetical protein CLOP_g5565 [Closterium sp. NIES-67]|nr:hypothetical protein CLOP_g5565 [Closterium sp. NIES-67]
MLLDQIEAHILFYGRIFRKEPLEEELRDLVFATVPSQLGSPTTSAGLRWPTPGAGAERPPLPPSSWTAAGRQRAAAAMCPRTAGRSWHLVGVEIVPAYGSDGEEMAGDGEERGGGGGGGGSSMSKRPVVAWAEVWPGSWRSWSTGGTTRGWLPPR